MGKQRASQPGAPRGVLERERSEATQYNKGRPAESSGRRLAQTQEKQRMEAASFTLTTLINALLIGLVIVFAAGWF